MRHHDIEQYYRPISRARTKALQDLIVCWPTLLGQRPRMTRDLMPEALLQAACPAPPKPAAEFLTSVLAASDFCQSVSQAHLSMLNHHPCMLSNF